MKYVCSTVNLEISYYETTIIMKNFHVKYYNPYHVNVNDMHVCYIVRFNFSTCKCSCYGLYNKISRFTYRMLSQSWL